MVFKCLFNLLIRRPRLFEIFLFVKGAKATDQSIITYIGKTSLKAC